MLEVVPNGGEAVQRLCAALARFVGAFIAPRSAVPRAGAAAVLSRSARFRSARISWRHQQLQSNSEWRSFGAPPLESVRAVPARGADAQVSTSPSNEAFQPTLAKPRAAESCRWASSMSGRLLSSVAAASLAAVMIPAEVVRAAEDPADVDRAMLLALPWKQFDQTLGSGWRVYAARGEHHEAAELIVAYLEQRADLTVSQRAVSNLHAGAEFARVGLTERALRHLDEADVPPGTKGVPEDWNELVISMRAFLLGDRAALLASKQRVDAMRKPAFRGSADRYLKYFGQRFGVWDEETPR